MKRGEEKVGPEDARSVFTRAYAIYAHKGGHEPEEKKYACEETVEKEVLKKPYI